MMEIPSTDVVIKHVYSKRNTRGAIEEMVEYKRLTADEVDAIREKAYHVGIADKLEVTVDAGYGYDLNVLANSLAGYVRKIDEYKALNHGQKAKRIAEYYAWLRDPKLRGYIEVPYQGPTLPEELPVFVGEKPELTQKRIEHAWLYGMPVAMRVNTMYMELRDAYERGYVTDEQYETAASSLFDKDGNVSIIADQDKDGKITKETAPGMEWLTAWMRTHTEGIRQ